MRDRFDMPSESYAAALAQLVPELLKLATNNVCTERTEARDARRVFSPSSTGLVSSSEVGDHRLSLSGVLAFTELLVVGASGARVGLDASLHLAVED
jgi:hypothetical protein